MKFSIREDKLDYATYERLFNEAWDYISAERQRMGADALKAGMWDAHKKLRSLIFEEDGYVVGTATFEVIDFEDKKFAFYKYPTFGENESGSRAWFYSEEYRNAASKVGDIIGVDGVVYVANPNSPAMIAIQNKRSNNNDVYSEMEIKEVSEVFPELKNIPTGFKAFIARR